MKNYASWSDNEAQIRGDQTGSTALVKILTKGLREQIISARYMVQSVAAGAEPDSEKEVIFEDYGAVAKHIERKVGGNSCWGIFERLCAK